MHKNIRRSLPQRITLTSVHLFSLLISGWIYFGSGETFLAGIFGKPEVNTPEHLRILMFSLATIYFMRLVFTSFILLKRLMPWEEVYAVGPFVTFIQIFFTILTVYNKASFQSTDWIWIAMFVTGSYLNTYSEWQRMIWKKYPENKGRLYTKGLFRYSMHINYFGDTVSFAGFGLLTGSIWGLSISLVMTLGFIFFHIPNLDKHLKEHYGKQFDEYSKMTKKFVPWIY